MVIISTHTRWPVTDKRHCAWVQALMGKVSNHRLVMCGILQVDCQHQHEGPHRYFECQSFTNVLASTTLCWANEQKGDHDGQHTVTVYFTGCGCVKETTAERSPMQRRDSCLWRAELYFTTQADLVTDMHLRHTICAHLQCSAQMRIASMQAQLGT